MAIANDAWVPESCTLPTVERPLRSAEVDRLLAQVATRVERLDAQRVRVTLPSRPEIAAQAAQLAVRETRCCSFFTFALTATAGELHLDITVPATRTAVLDALLTEP